MIVYALISRADGTVLVESTTSGMEGNFPQVTRVVLDRLKDDTDESLESSLLPEGTRRTFVHKNNEEEEDWGAMDIFPTVCMPSGCYGDYGMDARGKNYFHVARENGVIYLCLADDVAGRRHNVNFSFLEEIRTEFTTKYSPQKIRKANAYAMDKAFSSVLRLVMHNYNTNQNAGMSQSVAALSAQIDDLKSIMGRNINMIMQREENIELLVKKSEEVEQETAVFTKNGRLLKKQEKNRNIKLTLIVGFGIFILLFVMVVSVCGMSFDKCKADENER